jgi:ATP-dependent helicase HrpB
MPARRAERPNGAPFEMPPLDPLPVDEILDNLRAALADGTTAVLIAAPGAGKTTRVPLALLDEPWARGRKILVLEPRRLAARAAASRMAQLLGQDVGETIGLRVRLETRTSARTRVEIVTEGVFARMIVDDPALAGVAAVLFDEFHERSLDADLGLALALESQAVLREDLRLLVMSATIDGARTSSLLKGPVIESSGRAFPVETFYLGRDPGQRIEQAMANAILRALSAEPGSILAFLPGRGEIDRTAERLKERLDPEVVVAPLHGSLDREAQDRAVRPPPPGRRKIVLATSIAETSLTIEGVRVVVDSGLSRTPRYEPGLGLTRLETVRVSRASADQRRGRAGRVEPGVCYRLWEEAATGALVPFAPPEILAADLSGLMLDLAAWGARDPSSLAWLDPPPSAAVAEARALLRRLGAIDEEGALAEDGRAMRALPLPPRLARMTVLGARSDKAALAAEIAVVLSERGIAPGVVDVAERVRRLRRDTSKIAQDSRRLARVWSAIAAGGRANAANDADFDDACGALLALAYPDRIAKARGKPGEFLMANGRAAALDPSEPLARENWLAIAEVAGRAGAQRVLAAARLRLEDAKAVSGETLELRDETWFDENAAALRRRATTRIGAVVAAEQLLAPVLDAEAAKLLARGAVGLGLKRLPWTPQLSQWRDRVLFLRSIDGQEWPDLSDAALARAPEDWLAPALQGRASLMEVSPEDLASAVRGLLDWRLARRLDDEAPTHFTTPAGSSLAIDYAAEGGPALRARVQELFGLDRHPTIVGGRARLVLHLLSPASRPIQITRDLPGFWKGSWSQVAAEMRGRYPKHFWPDDPARAAPTTRAKPRA